MDQQTQEYLAIVAAAAIKSLDSFDADCTALQRQAPLFSAQLSLELVELQQAVLSDNDPTRRVPLNNALQRTQFCLSRVDKLLGVLQELRTGLKDLRQDRADVAAPPTAP